MIPFIIKAKTCFHPDYLAVVFSSPKHQCSHHKHMGGEAFGWDKLFFFVSIFLENWLKKKKLEEEEERKGTKQNQRKQSKSMNPCNWAVGGWICAGHMHWLPAIEHIWIFFIRWMEYQLVQTLRAWNELLWLVHSFFQWLQLCFTKTSLGIFLDHCFVLNCGELFQENKQRIFC